MCDVGAKLSDRYYDLAYAYNSDAFYACKLSLAYLRIHTWWDNVRPSFPSQLRSWVDVLFTCKYENWTHVPSGWWSSRRVDRLKSPEAASIFEKLMDLFDLDVISDALGEIMAAFSSEDLGDLLETIFLAGLIILFIAVYRRRQRNRNQRQVIER